MSEDEICSPSTSFIFPKRNRGAGRKVSTRLIKSPSTSSEDDSHIVKIAPRKRKRTNPMIQSSNSRRVVAVEKPGSESSSEASDTIVEGAFASTGTADRIGPSDMGATAVSEIDTDIKCDAQAQFERVQKAIKEGYDEKVYRGAAMYGAKEKKDTARGNASSGLNRVGPIRAPAFLRQSVRWDFAPDICKDYKETGFCTFGDSCKFLHDRTDYKHGWEIERDYESGRMKEDDDGKYLIKSDEDNDTLPFKCFICRDSFKNPVVTRCKHYFCEKCALDHFRKTQKCFVCDSNTMGVFSIAKDLVERLAAKSKNNVEAENNSGPEDSYVEKNRIFGIKEEKEVKSEDSDH